MPTEPRKQAATHAKRATKQAGHAAKNGAQAAKLTVEPVVDNIEDAAEGVVDAARRVDTRTLSRLAGDTGQGFIALSVALWAGAIAANKFRGAFAGRNQVMRPE